MKAKEGLIAVLLLPALFMTAGCPLTVNGQGFWGTGKNVTPTPKPSSSPVLSSGNSQISLTAGESKEFDLLSGKGEGGQISFSRSENHFRIVPGTGFSFFDAGTSAIGEAPESGYLQPTEGIEIIEGHVYVVRISSLPVRYARITITSIEAGRIEFLFFIRLDGSRSFQEPVASPAPSPTPWIPGSLNLGATLSDGPTIPLPAGRISGSVVDALNFTFLGSVLVNVLFEGKTIATTTTDPGGAFSLLLPPGSGYTLEISKDGYESVSYGNIQVSLNSTTYLQTVSQVPLGSGGNGGAEGKIVDAFNGQGVGGLRIAIRRGINAIEGKLVTLEATRRDGTFSLSGLPQGNYTIEISGEGYTTCFHTVPILEGKTALDVIEAVTAVLDASKLRIVLTWAYQPADLDAHLSGPGEGERFHLYYDSRSFGAGLSLDHDERAGFGPETITIGERKAGIYRFAVHNFSRKSETSHDFTLADSIARVKVYQGSNLLSTFNVPSSKEGTLWTVFKLSDGIITPINQMSYQTSGEVAP
ncbi:MAG TPA: hypothetical protein DD435_06955 [Cyanobacteria bacterium UBA8530]|nr:hypothetical protein [Cyanobacteria bacterium UBA8530]